MLFILLLPKLREVTECGHDFLFVFCNVVWYIVANVCNVALGLTIVVDLVKEFQ